MSTCTPQSRKIFQRGFTLMELMITVAVVGILAAIALPSFNEQIAKSRRATAKATLLGSQQWVERFYSENYSYAANSAGTAMDDSSQFGARFTTSPAPGEGTVMYNITVETPLSASSYRIFATRTGGMASDRCGDYIIDNYGRKSLVNWNTTKFADAAAAANYCWN